MRAGKQVGGKGVVCWPVLLEVDVFKLLVCAGFEEYSRV